jgi:hypothetical protein
MDRNTTMVAAAPRVSRGIRADERFHGLRHAGDVLVHGMPDDPLLAGEAVHRL